MTACHSGHLAVYTLVIVVVEADCKKLQFSYRVTQPSAKNCQLVTNEGICKPVCLLYAARPIGAAALCVAPRPSVHLSVHPSSASDFLEIGKS